MNLQKIELTDQWQEITIESGTFQIMSNQNDSIIYFAKDNQGTDEFILPREGITKTGDNQLTIYARSSQKTAQIIITDTFFFRLAGNAGGGGGVTYDFVAPFINNNNTISLLTANDLKVENNALTLDLLSNPIILNMLEQITALRGSIFIAGNIGLPNSEVEQNTELLTEYIQNTQARAPRVGDAVFTNDTPAGVWMWGEREQDGGIIELWIFTGFIGSGIATLEKVGLVKGGNNDGELNIAEDGTASVRGAVLISGNQTIGGNKEFTGGLTFYRANDFALPSSGIDFAIRFQCDQIGANRNFDLLRIHKAGSKWALRIKTNNSNAFEACEISGLTRFLSELQVSNLKVTGNNIIQYTGTIPTASENGHVASYGQLNNEFVKYQGLILPQGTTPTPENIPAGQFKFVIR